MATSDPSKNAKIGKELYQTVQEQRTPVPTTIKGTIPEWINGSLVRVGPGKFEWGKQSYNHWFDGDCIIHQFRFMNGKVIYRSQYLQSNSYKISKKYGRIAMPSFGTWAPPDPCKSTFERMMMYFLPPEMTDNCNVNPSEVKGEIFASTETPIMYEIDPYTLETLNEVDCRTKLGKLRSWLAHPHIDEAGNHYNVTTAWMKGRYEFVRIPAKLSTTEGVWDGMSTLARVGYSGFTPSYFHSFGMTPNYFILFENPLKISSLFKTFIMNFKHYSYFDILKWKPELGSKIHVIDRHTGAEVKVFTVDVLFVFHHVNAYEEDGCIIVDLCGYEDPSIIHAMYLKKLRNGLKDVKYANPFLRRYVLPMRDTGKNRGTCEKLGVYPDGKDHITILECMELPRINYAYNGKKYTYSYGVGFAKGDIFKSKLVKVNVQTKEHLEWTEEDTAPSEPLFIASPNAIDEDDGVVFSTVVGVLGKKSFLLVLDAKTFKEIGRAEVDCKLIPALHGAFLS